MLFTESVRAKKVEIGSDRSGGVCVLGIAAKAKNFKRVGENLRVIISVERKSEIREKDSKNSPDGPTVRDNFTDFRT